MKTEKIFTIEEHKENAILLIGMRHKLLELLVATGKVYGVNSKEVRAIQRAKLGVEKLRCVLDSDVMLEHPELQVKELNFYYGGG